MPRWAEDYIRKITCPKCYGRKTFYSELCRKCRDYLVSLNRNKERIDKRGYIYIRYPGHPKAHKREVYKHIYLAERALGRPLPPIYT